MRSFGRAAGHASTHQEAQFIIDGLLATIRNLRSKEVITQEEEQTVFALKAAIEGIRETMPNPDEAAD